MSKHFLSFLLIIILLNVSCAKKEILTFELSQSELDMYVTEQSQLKAAVSFSGMSSVEMIWESSDSTVASVNSDGVVTALKAGTTIVSVSCGEQRRECHVKVNSETFALFKAINDNGLSQTIFWKDGNVSFTTSETLK